VLPATVDTSKSQPLTPPLLLHAVNDDDTETATELALVDDKVSSPLLVAISAELAVVIAAAELATSQECHVDEAEKVIAPAAAQLSVTRPVISLVFVSVIAATTVIVPVLPAIGVIVSAVQVIDWSSMLSISITVGPLLLEPEAPPSSIAPHGLVMLNGTDVVPSLAISCEVASAMSISRALITMPAVCVAVTFTPDAIVTAPVVEPVQPRSAVRTRPELPVAVKSPLNVIISLELIVVNTAADDDKKPEEATVIEPLNVPPTVPDVVTPAKKASWAVAVSVHCILLIVIVAVDGPPMVTIVVLKIAVSSASSM
jgi:hypothetical protein